MSGFWIKWEKGVSRKPEVLQIASKLGIPPVQAAGCLMLLMEWLDESVTELSQDGHAEIKLGALSPAFIDRIVGLDRFAESLIEVRWVEVEGGVLRFINVAKHNGVTAKKRADGALRQRRSRINRGSENPGRRDIIPRALRRFILERDRYQCVYCGAQSSKQEERSESAKHPGILSIDHIIPASEGGATIAGNLVCACRSCNQEKGDRTPQIWGRSMAFLQADVIENNNIVTIESHERVTDLLRLCSVSESESISLGIIGGGEEGKTSSDAVYDLYPRKEGRKAAIKAIEKAAGSGASWQHLVERTRAYAAAVALWPREARYTREGVDTVPHPATWFNRGSYDDDPATWERKSPEKPQRSMNFA